MKNSKVEDKINQQGMTEYTSNDQRRVQRQRERFAKKQEFINNLSAEEKADFIYNKKLQMKKTKILSELYHTFLNAGYVLYKHENRDNLIIYKNGISLVIEVKIDAEQGKIINERRELTSEEINKYITPERFRQMRFKHIGINIGEVNLNDTNNVTNVKLCNIFEVHEELLKLGIKATPQNDNFLIRHILEEHRRSIPTSRLEDVIESVHNGKESLYFLTLNAGKDPGILFIVNSKGDIHYTIDISREHEKGILKEVINNMIEPLSDENTEHLKTLLNEKSKNMDMF